MNHKGMKLIEYIVAISILVILVMLIPALMTVRDLAEQDLKQQQTAPFEVLPEDYNNIKDLVWHKFQYGETFILSIDHDQGAAIYQAAPVIQSVLKTDRITIMSVPTKKLAQKLFKITETTSEERDGKLIIWFVWPETLPERKILKPTLIK